MKTMKTGRMSLLSASLISLALISCGGQMEKDKASMRGGALGADVASQVYVNPGEHDEFYAMISGGFSGQLAIYGLPSCRLFKVIPVFSLDAEKGYGFNEETKPLLNTSYGFIPWDDSHHPEL